jgi:hypothetical protein
MASAKVSTLTKLDILDAAKNLRWRRRMPKWTVVVEGRELPARPLVLDAAGALPNDPTNSHQAVALLKDWGFEVLYQGRPLEKEIHSPARLHVTEKLISSLRGSYKGRRSLVELREREHRDDRY